MGFALSQQAVHLLGGLPTDVIRRGRITGRFVLFAVCSSTQLLTVVICALRDELISITSVSLADESLSVNQLSGVIGKTKHRLQDKLAASAAQVPITSPQTQLFHQSHQSVSELGVIVHSLLVLDKKIRKYREQI